MYMLLIASPVINICSTVAWCRPYPWWYFTIFYFQCFPLAGLRLRFFWYVFPQDRQLLGCFFGRWFLIIPCTFSFCSDLATRSGCSFSLQVCSLLATHLPLRQVFFWPAILTPRYPVSGTPLPLRHVFFWPAILTPRYPVFGTPLPLRHDFFWPAILTPRSPFSGTPGPSFHSLFWCPWSSVSTPSFFPTQPSLPGYLGGRLALCAALRFACDFYRSAVFTAPRFLPLRGFYRSAVFIAPLSPVFWGLCSSAALMLAAPQSSPTSGRLALCAALRYACDFYRSAVFTAPRFFPLCGFYRSAFAGFFFFFFWGLCSSAALLLAAPQSSSSSGRTLWCRLVRSVSGGPPFLTLFLYRLLHHSRSVAAHLTGFPFVHFIQIRGPSIVSSFGCRDTGTACTSTSLWNLTAHGNKAFSPQTDGSAVCRYAYWSMKWLYLQMARSQSVVWFPPHSPDTRSPGPRDSLIFNWNILLHHITL